MSWDALREWFEGKKTHAIVLAIIGMLFFQEGAIDPETAEKAAMVGLISTLKAFADRAVDKIAAALGRRR